MFVCGVLLVVVHGSLGLAPSANFFIPYFPLFILGIVYSFLLLYWPICTLLVPKKVLSTSYGIAFCLLNLSLTVFPLLIATVMTYDPTFYSSQMIFVGCGASAAIICLVVHKLDHDEHGNVLLLKA